MRISSARSITSPSSPPTNWSTAACQLVTAAHQLVSLPLWVLSAPVRSTRSTQPTNWRAPPTNWSVCLYGLCPLFFTQVSPANWLAALVIV
jgi:hypothetical protein